MAIHTRSSELRAPLPRPSAAVGYRVAKHALRGYCSSVRAELVHDRSRVWISEVHIPALNTPQFRLLRSHTPRKAQPVSPVHQPEVAARAVVCANTPRRRTVWVAPSTVGTVVGGTVEPRLLDLFLGRTDYDAQQIDEPEQPERPDCLDSPVPGEHGPYGDQAHARRLQLALNIDRPTALIGVPAAAVGAVAANSARANR